MTFWAPINPPVLQTRDEQDQKDSHAFPGTHMQFHVKQVYVEYAEFSTDNPAHLPDPPFGLPKPPPLPPVPPYPTGRTQWQMNGPRVRVSADIHMTPAAVESMKGNEQAFSDLMSTFTSGPAALFFALGHATYKFGLQKAKNQDGSLDIHIDVKGATAGGNPILLPPDTCMAILQGA